MKRSFQILSFPKRVYAWLRSWAPFAFCLLLVFQSGQACASNGFDFFSLTLGTNQSDVTTILSRNAIEFWKADLETITCSPIQNHNNSLKEIVLTFDRDNLRKISAYFHIPVTSSDAGSVVRVFREQKSSIVAQYGSPSEDIEEMKTDRVEDRLAWLTRGRAYYRTNWKIGETAIISLWLYGEDSGLVLFKSMESTKK